MSALRDIFLACPHVYDMVRKHLTVRDRALISYTFNIDEREGTDENLVRDELEKFYSKLHSGKNVLLCIGKGRIGEPDLYVIEKFSRYHFVVTVSKYFIHEDSDFFYRVGNTSRKLWREHSSRINAYYIKI
jgi:hypothetical protein